jgi:hypothetical protein
MTTLPAGGRRGRTRHPRGGRRLLLLPLVAFAAPALVAFVYIGYVLWPRWPGPPVDADAPPLPIIVGGVAFNLPPAAIRVPVQRRPGVQERVDLAYLCPSLAPPDPDAKSTPPAPGAEAAPVSAVERVFVTISRAGDTLPPTERAREIYPRYTPARRCPARTDWRCSRSGRVRPTRADRLSRTLHPQRRRADTGRLPLRAPHRRRRRVGALPARLAVRLAHGGGQYRPVDRKPAALSTGDALRSTTGRFARRRPRASGDP